MPMSSVGRVVLVVCASAVLVVVGTLERTDLCLEVADLACEEVDMVAVVLRPMRRCGLRRVMGREVLVIAVRRYEQG